MPDPHPILQLKLIPNSFHLIEKLQRVIYSLFFFHFQNLKILYLKWIILRDFRLIYYHLNIFGHLKAFQKANLHQEN